ncbi:MAG: hypothetical protein QOD51_1908, partial [Candidatus Eremiobacteraeota bacterium]|nr:hypothetical protein [Candidatus Eremiobacteraeota bacterium]
TLHLRVNDAVSDDVPDPNHTKGIVSFVLVQQPGGEYQVVWIHDSEAVIPKAELLTDASVVPAEPPSNNGSITGPMGFTLP